MPDHVILKVASGGKVDGGTVETDPEARINFTNITRDRYYLSLKRLKKNCCILCSYVLCVCILFIRHPAGCSAKEITEHAMDASYRLEMFISEHAAEEV